MKTGMSSEKKLLEHDRKIRVLLESRRAFLRECGAEGGGFRISADSPVFVRADDRTMEFIDVLKGQLKSIATK